METWMIITLFVAIIAIVLIAIVAMGVIGFYKIRQAWAKLLKQHGHRDD